MAEPGADSVSPSSFSGWQPVPVALPEPGRSISFEVPGRRILLCNVDGTPYALEDLCPHVRVPLGGGRLVGHVLQCPLHGGRLDVRDGSPVERPIRRPAVVFPVRQHDGALEIDLGPAPEDS